MLVRNVNCGLAAAVLCAIFIGSPSASSDVEFDTIGGPLPKVIKGQSVPYLVVSDIEVPLGKIVRIQPGAVFLFKNFTGFHVEGRLIAEGTVDNPIVFTSEYDRKYNPASTLYPNPYDWNGIYIHSNAIGTSMLQTKVLYSVYGVRSDTKFIQIKSGLFRNNGKTNLVIEEQEHIMTNDPYTYELSIKDATVDGVPVRILADPNAPRRNLLRYSGVAGFLAGAGVGALNTMQLLESQNELHELSNTSVVNMSTHTQAEWAEAKERRDEDRIWAALGYGIGLAGVAGFTLSFTF